jgi:hypothetical protein
VGRSGGGCAVGKDIPETYLMIEDNVKISSENLGRC